MICKNLIHYASLKPISEEDLTQAASSVGMSLDEFCDTFARTVAQGYLRGEYTWQFGDDVMNRLHASSIESSHFKLPDFAWQVFLAFDESEYIHSESPEL